MSGLPRIKWTIGEVMAAVPYAAVMVWLLRDGYVLPFVGMAGLALAFVCWASLRGRPRSAAIAFGATVIAANGLVAPFCLYLQGWGWIGVAVGLFGGLPMGFGFGTAWAIAAMRSETDSGRPTPASRHPMLAIVLALSMAMTPLMTLWTFWPLRLAFLISRPALERMADQVAAGEAPAFPIRIGLHRIVGFATDRVTGRIALITDPNPGGRMAFVRSQESTDDEPFPRFFMRISLSRTWSFEMVD